MASLADLYGPQYTPAPKTGGIVGPSPSDMTYMLRQVPNVEGPTPSQIQVGRGTVTGPTAADQIHIMPRVEVGTPQIESPQYSVNVGDPQIEKRMPTRAEQAAQAAQARNDEHLREKIRQKMTYSKVLGVPGDTLLTMSQLAKAGLDAGPDERGLPYGLDPTKLNRVELAWLTRKAK